MAKRPAKHGPRTRKHYEDTGWMVGKTDCTGSRRRPSHDLFGFVDMIGFKTTDVRVVPGPGGEPVGVQDYPRLQVVLIQYTDSTSHSKHRKKILASERAKRVVQMPDVFIHLLSWRKKDGRYVSRLQQINADDFE